MAPPPATPPTSRYGLAPNYGCCTANFNQGWPKLAQSVAMATPDGNTIVIGIYAPVTINQEGGVSLTITTDYPFQDTGQLMHAPPIILWLCPDISQLAYTVCVCFSKCCWKLQVQEDSHVPGPFMGRWGNNAAQGREGHTPYPWDPQGV